MQQEELKLALEKIDDVERSYKSLMAQDDSRIGVMKKALKVYHSIPLLLEVIRTLLEEADRKELIIQQQASTIKKLGGYNDGKTTDDI